MEFMPQLFDKKGYIEGITIINVAGEILFSAKFNNKLGTSQSNYEIVGKNFMDIYENLDENNSTTYQAMSKGTPVYIEHQILKSVGREPIEITSLSIPIKSGGTIVGAIDLSVSDTDNEGEVTTADKKDSERFNRDILYGYNNVGSLEHKPNTATYYIDDIQTCDPSMLKLKENIVRVAQTDMPVLIYGETGTGKELVVHAIHNLSKRANKPFVVQNCASIPANLLESILFGTSKGAFTGAVDNVGLLEIADGGTLFLDEINSLSLELQPKLLRVLQNGMFRRIGDKVEKHVDVRIITSSNEYPKDIVADNRLRKDLYYRLSVMYLEIPPLRDRKKDIPLLANIFLGKYNKMFGRRIHQISDELLAKLMELPWEGNVRELENVIAHGVGMSDATTEVLDMVHMTNRLSKYSKIHEDKSTDVGDKPLNDIIDAYERKVIAKALRMTDGNITKASEILKVPRQTLSRKVNKFNL